MHSLSCPHHLAFRWSGPYQDFFRSLLGFIGAVLVKSSPIRFILVRVNVFETPPLLFLLKALNIL